MVIYLEIKKGDYVTRNSYNNDTLFKVIKIVDDIAYLKGYEVRLCADARITDLRLEENIKSDDDLDNMEIKNEELERGDYFFLPPKVMQIDSDSEFLARSLKFYKKNGIMAIGKRIDEANIAEQLELLLKEHKPDILVITGHDSYNKKNNDPSNIKNYKNSAYFVKAVKVARKYEKSHEKLLIIAGACQSDYEELIKAGANFASSPKRVNIHALDPAIIASTISLTERNKEINLKELLEKTKYKEEGMGGLMCNGLMYVGYPR
jgi:spore coat assembly protein